MAAFAVNAVLDTMMQKKILVQFYNYFVIEKVQWQLLVVQNF